MKWKCFKNVRFNTWETNDSNEIKNVYNRWIEIEDFGEAKHETETQNHVN